MSTDEPSIGATGKAFGFSLGRGRNGHFPDTAKRFRDGVDLFLSGGGAGKEEDDGADDDGRRRKKDGDGEEGGGEEELFLFLPPVTVDFPPYDGSIVILGKLAAFS